VNKGLAESRAEGMPQLVVWNKIDLGGLRPGCERDEYGRICRVLVSARTGAGLAGLRAAIAAAVAPQKRAADSPDRSPNPSPELSL
jgi:GTP-binding protein HflX